MEPLIISVKSNSLLYVKCVSVLLPAGSQRNANGSLNGEVNNPQSNGQNLESKVLMEGQG